VKSRYKRDFPCVGNCRMRCCRMKEGREEGGDCNYVDKTSDSIREVEKFGIRLPGQEKSRILSSVLRKKPIVLAPER